MFAIVDCNNFYASCERLFDPKIRNRPVVVLSNNDGCVIARSEEAKALGIKMGDAAFEVETVLEKHNVAVFSSNYTLYADMSARVMHTLGSFTPNIEIYSIDESFLDLSNMIFTNLDEYAREIRETVRAHVGIPVGIGVGPTKTLAKAANKYAKKKHRDKGVFVIDSEEKRIEVLKWLPLEDVWGIGHRYAYKLAEHGIKTAYDLSRLSQAFIQKGDGKSIFQGMGVVGQRLIHELNGMSCLPLDLVANPKKNICTSRSFPTDITELIDLENAIATHTTRCAEKLRKDNSVAGLLQVFVMTNPFKNFKRQYSRCVPVVLNTPTNSTNELIRYAMYVLRKVFKPGYGYKKCGVIVSEISPADQIQSSIFDKVDRKKNDKLMNALDAINGRMGQDTVRFAASGYNRKWKLRREHLSKCFTTNPNELLTIRI